MEYLTGLFLLAASLSGYKCSTHSCHDETPSFMEFLVSIATMGTSMIVVYDGSFDYTSQVLETMMYHNNRLTIYEYRLFDKYLGYHMTTILKNDPSPELRRNLNFLVMCEEECVQDMLIYEFMMESTMMIYTLLWMPGHRNWARVHTCDLSGDQLYYSLFPNTQRGLNGRQLVLSMLEWLPFSKRHVSNRKVGYTGAGKDIIDILRKHFNFSYVIVEPEDMSWGQELENGNWSGILGMILRLEADLCPVPYYLTLPKKNAFDISLISTSEISALYKQRKNSTHWLYYLSCFSWPVILCGSCSLIWIVVLFWCTNKQRRTCHFYSEESSASHCLEIGIYIPLRQAILMLPEVTSARILICTWCLFCLIMTAIYTGNLIAFATVDKQKPPFTTLQELVELGGYEVGVMEETYVHDMFMNSDDQIYKNIYRKLIKPIKTSNTTHEELSYHTMHRLLEDMYVLMAFESTRDIIMSRTCEVVEMKEKMFPVHGGFVFPRFSPLKKLLDSKLMHLKELGIIDKMLWKWSPKPMICASAEPSPKFNLKSLSTVLVTCGTGIVMAVVMLIFEMWKRKYNFTLQ